MEITLEMVEKVKDKTGVSYKEAKQALENADGNVVDAIIDIEESIGNVDEKVEPKESKAIIERLKDLVKKGNVSKILIKKDGEIVMNIPVNAGLIAGIIAPWATIAAVIATFGFKCVIEVVKDDGSIIDVSEMTNETIGAAVEKGAVFAEEIKSRGAVVYEAVREKGGEAYESVKGMASSRKEQFNFYDEDFTCSPLDDDCSDAEDDGVEVEEK